MRIFIIFVTSRNFSEVFLSEYKFYIKLPNVTLYCSDLVELISMKFNCVVVAISVEHCRLMLYTCPFHSSEVTVGDSCVKLLIMFPNCDQLTVVCLHDYLISVYLCFVHV